MFLYIDVILLKSAVRLLTVLRRWFSCCWFIVLGASHCLWGFCVDLCLGMHYFVSFLVLQSSWWGRESWLLCFNCISDVLFLLMGVKFSSDSTVEMKFNDHVVSFFFFRQVSCPSKTKMTQSPENYRSAIAAPLPSLMLPQTDSLLIWIQALISSALDV